MTMKFKKVYIKDYVTLNGSSYLNPLLNTDINIDDFYYKSDNIIGSEINYQKEVIEKLINKNNINKNKIDLLISSDLDNQLYSSNKCASFFHIPFFSIYTACSSFVSSLIIASTFIESNLMKKIIVCTSSHNLISERQFKNPIEYGTLKKCINTITYTGSVSSLITREESNLRIESATIGEVVDIGYKDVNNMGAVMTPSCAEVIYKHLKDTNRKIGYYDIILTGDLGIYGINILKDYLSVKYNIRTNKIKDAGSMIYDTESFDIAGASGPVVLPIVLFSKILKRKKYKKILIVGTGSLHNSETIKIKHSIPSVAHALSLEVIN